MKTYRYDEIDGAMKESSNGGWVCAESVKQAIAEAKAEQREMCADAVRIEFRALGFPLEPLVVNACLNAEED